MFHLAPVGLEPQRRINRDRHTPLQNQILTTIQKFKQNPKDTVYTNKDQLTRELVKCLDCFFCHGLIIPDKCYWRFVREFLPMSIQQSLRFEWNVNTDRGLSIAWLKNALNQQTLHFQMLAFVAQPKIAAKFYDKNACIRNQPVLKRVAVVAGDLGEVQFRVENTLQRRQYEAPVAQLSAQAPIVHVPSSSAIETKPFVKNRVLHNAAANDIILSASFQHANEEFMQRFPGNLSMAELTRDLPRVEVPSSAHEPFLSTTRDQDYMINEIVKTHRVRLQSHRRFSSEEEDQSKETTKSQTAPIKAENATERKSSSPVGPFRKRSPDNPIVGSFRQRRELDPETISSSSTFSTTSTDDEAEKQRKAPLKSTTNPIAIVQKLDQLEKPAMSLHDELNNTEMAATVELPIDSSNSSSPVQSAQSTSPDQELIENVDGDIALSSGEIIQMALSVFKDDVESFQKLFSVYVDHAVGQPKRRFMLLTDRYLYVLSATVAGETNNQLSRAEELSFLSSTPAMDSFGDNLTDDGSQTAQDSLQMNYNTEIEIQLEDIDYITLGVDAQSVNIHTKTHKFKTPTSDHEQKQFVVETASQKLGQCIVANIQRAIRKFTRKHAQVQVVSGTTLYSIILRNFVRRELGLPSVDLKHGALVYWLQCPAESKQLPELLEGYLFTRNFQPNAWRRKADKWSQKYFMLDRSKLYQFTDSSCKGAEFLLNIRERVEEVVELELKADEKFVLELRLNDNTPNIQLSFPTLVEMQKWMKNLSLILSTAFQEYMTPTACAMILTETTVLFVQEGANCSVDGFMRLLLQITFRDIAALASLNTLNHHLLILRRESGDSEIVFLRNESELQRLCSSFANHWQLNVEELSETSAQADPAYSRLYTQICSLNDTWSPEEKQYDLVDRI